MEAFSFCRLMTLVCIFILPDFQFFFYFLHEIFKSLMWNYMDKTASSSQRWSIWRQRCTHFRKHFLKRHLMYKNVLKINELLEMVTKMIKQQTSKSQWRFPFISTNIYEESTMYLLLGYNRKNQFGARQNLVWIKYSTTYHTYLWVSHPSLGFQWSCL